MDYILRKSEVLSMTATGAASALAVRKGRVWLTRPDDSRDFLLGPGERFPLEGDGICVLEALADATIVLEGVPVKDARTTIQVNLAFTRPVPAELG